MRGCGQQTFETLAAEVSLGHDPVGQPLAASWSWSVVKVRTLSLDRRRAGLGDDLGCGDNRRSILRIVSLLG
jgi:hypothetical protein